MPGLLWGDAAAGEGPVGFVDSVFGDGVGEALVGEVEDEDVEVVEG